MDSRNEIREFLTARRARITPEEAGLPSFGARRVPGLRRSEVAMLAGMSVEYYIRLERGSLSGASDSVLESLAVALRLDDLERDHLLRLAREANASAPTRENRRRRATGAKPTKVRPGVQRILDAMVAMPAFARTDYFDVVATNELARVLLAPLFDSPSRPVNTARYLFLDPGATSFFVDWERTAKESVGALRVAAGRNPYDKNLSNLIGELSTRSSTFGTWWAAQDVYAHRAGTKRFRHPVVGELELTFEALDLPGDEGLGITTYGAEPGSPSADALRLLSSWTATPSTTGGTDDRT